MALLLIVSDHSFVGGIVSTEGSIAVAPAAAGRKSLHCRTSFDERGLFGEILRGQNAQRCDVVNYPDASPVRRNHQILVPRMNCQIANRYVRQLAAFILRPLLA